MQEDRSNSLHFRQKRKRSPAQTAQTTHVLKWFPLPCNSLRSMLFHTNRTERKVERKIKSKICS